MTAVNYNPILDTDSYKFFHYLQYPPNTTMVFSYIESRGGKYDNAIFFGLQIYLKEYLSVQITHDMIDEAESFVDEHIPQSAGEFNRAGWEYIVNEHNGYMPIVIKAASEGKLIPTRNVLVTIQNTDPKCFWITSYIETALLRVVWYATTVATNSYHSKQVILQYLEKTGDPTGINFTLNDFGFRGVSSYESAGIGGASHLVNFTGSDNVAGVRLANDIYTCEMSAFSVNASEHSTMTSWGGRDGEIDAMRNMLKQFAKPGAVVAIVSDSYDIYHAAEHLWGDIFKQDIIDSGAIVVIRPDSGHPATVVLNIANILMDKFGFSINKKGYKVINNVRIIQGDGIVTESINEILDDLTNAGFSADNVVFGQGGGLLQQLDRDTLKFAMKASAIEVNKEWRDVYKDPITDKGKRSKRGRQELMWNPLTDEYRSVQLEEALKMGPEWEFALETVFEDGYLIRDMTFDEVRRNAGTIM